MMDGFSVAYIFDNDVHLDYIQLYLHPRALKKLPNGQWHVIYGNKGTIELDYSSWTLHDIYWKSERVEHEGVEGIDLTEQAHNDFVLAIREYRSPVADIEVATPAALTSIMGREAISQRRMITWDEMGVTV